MAEEKEEKEEERVQPLPAPQSHAEFLSAHFSKLVLLLAGLFLATYFPVDEAGRTFLSVEQMVIGLALLLVAFVVVPGMMFFRRSREIAGMYVPYDPEHENNDLERKVESVVGGNVRINRVLGEPEFGEKSSEPYVMHFQATHTSRQGITQPISFKASLISRAILSIEPKHSHIEDSVFSWAAFQKYPKLRQPPKLIYKVREAAIKPEIPRKEGEEGEEEGEED